VTCDTPVSIRQVLTPQLIKALAIFSWTVTVIFCLNALFPLYLFTPIALGGQDKTPRQIAQVGATSACFQAFWLLQIMPRLDRRLGTRKLFILIASFLPVQMMNPVIANVLARRGQRTASLVIIGVYASAGQFVNMSFSELVFSGLESIIQEYSVCTADLEFVCSTTRYSVRQWDCGSSVRGSQIHFPNSYQCALRSVSIEAAVAGVSGMGSHDDDGVRSDSLRDMYARRIPDYEIQAVS
jgi:hypothetical protein